MHFSPKMLAVLLCVVSLSLLTSASAQSTNASLSGQVTDVQGLVVVGAEVDAENQAMNVVYSTKTNGEGFYSLPDLPPGTYEIHILKDGFRTLLRPGIELHVQDARSLNATLQVGDKAEIVRVEGGAPQINTESAAVSTVVDRQFAENLPLNGRSFQTLIQLTPGVVTTISNSGDNGQFSINGQRAASNYWTLDGVGANIGIGTGFPGNGLGGTLGSFSALGGTNSLVSVDAMQEFRIQTSTYAPEFGRTPGGQISIVTRSGTNQFHGTAFDYLRNDVLDANNWFNGVNILNPTPLPKAEERQNDFGGTFSGAIVRGRAFFFFSYEGLRLRLPETSLTTVPCDSTCTVSGNARTTAAPAMQPFLNAFPLPNGPDLGNGTADLRASYSNPGTLDAYSLRIDHRLNDRVSFFGRYNYSPSELDIRGGPAGGPALSVVSPSRITTQTGTVGATWTATPSITDDARFNYSRANAASSFYMDNFGGAVPLASLPFPSPFAASNANLSVHPFASGIVNPVIGVGRLAQNAQRQINLVDSLGVQKGSHSLKVGVDFRRLTPVFNPSNYAQQIFFIGLPNFEKGTLCGACGQIESSLSATFVFNNLGLYAQDSWKIMPRLNITYGIRWDIDFAPSTNDGPNIAAVTGFNLGDLSQLALAPAGTRPFKTKFGNLAPRIGAAYQVTERADWQFVVRGGFGLFYDLVSSEFGNLVSGIFYPFGNRIFKGGTFPFDPATVPPPPVTPPGPGGQLFAFDPNLELPYTLQWNVSIEQGLGRGQSLSASYIGAVGRRLLQTSSVISPNLNLGAAALVSNTSSSDYDALQVQFQRRLSHGLQSLASYTWSHSIDTGSAGSTNIGSNTFVPGFANANRGSSDFDVRHAVSAALTYDVTPPKTSLFADSILRGWSLENVFQARSAPPIDVFNSTFGFGILSNAVTLVRPDVAPGIPLYLYGPQYPGGKALNNTPGAVPGGCRDGSQSVGPFCPPPIDSMTGSPLRQGNLGRNALRGFGAWQWDFAVHRTIPIHEFVKLQFRAEMFNILNHPNFGQPTGDLSLPTFGLATQMLGQSLNLANSGGGALNPLYQIGGPRSIQVALKFMF